MAGSVASPIITVELRCEMKAVHIYIGDIKKHSAVAETASHAT